MVGLVWFYGFKVIFNNISVISWLSVVLVEDTGVRGKNHRPIANNNIDIQFIVHDTLLE
jgi:hypothetical protein